MELELGLALPDQSPMMIKGLDLNSCSNDQMEMQEIEKRKKGDCNKYNRHLNSTCDEEVDSKRSSSLLWSGQPDDGDQARKRRNNHEDEEDSEEDEETLMGWPPINWLRRESLLHHHLGGGAAAAGVIRNSMYVKVKMEGVAIGRKIDLRLYNSYQAFTDSLINMFAKYIKNYTISYQDKEGDWMLVGDDVPWETFVESVKRIEILRNAN